MSSYAYKDFNVLNEPNSRIETESFGQIKRIEKLPKENVRVKFYQKKDKEENIGNNNNSKTIDESIQINEVQELKDLVEVLNTRVKTDEIVSIFYPLDRFIRFIGF